MTTFDEREDPFERRLGHAEPLHEARARRTPRTGFWAADAPAVAPLLEVGRGSGVAAHAVLESRGTLGRERREPEARHQEVVLAQAEPEGRAG